MENTFTPGPWELQAGRSINTSSGSFYLSYGKDKNGNPNFRDFCELDRNAQLIAAAPDLLAALECVAPYINQKGVFNMVQSAIAKAKGDCHAR